jgi:hypothetical protein
VVDARVAQEDARAVRLGAIGLLLVAGPGALVGLIVGVIVGVATAPPADPGNFGIDAREVHEPSSPSQAPESALALDCSPTCSGLAAHNERVCCRSDT